jgi:hypothetical protein
VALAPEAAADAASVGGVVGCAVVVMLDLLGAGAGRWISVVQVGGAGSC